MFEPNPDDISRKWIWTLTYSINLLNFNPKPSPQPCNLLNFNPKPSPQPCPCPCCNSHNNKIYNHAIYLKYIDTYGNFIWNIKYRFIFEVWVKTLQFHRYYLNMDKKTTIPNQPNLTKSSS